MNTKALKRCLSCLLAFVMMMTPLSGAAESFGGQVLPVAEPVAEKQTEASEQEQPGENPEDERKDVTQEEPNARVTAVDSDVLETEEAPAAPYLFKTFDSSDAVVGYPIGLSDISPDGWLRMQLAAGQYVWLDDATDGNAAIADGTLEFEFKTGGSPAGFTAFGRYNGSKTNPVFVGGRYSGNGTWAVDIGTGTAVQQVGDPVAGKTEIGADARQSNLKTHPEKTGDL